MLLRINFNVHLDTSILKLMNSTNGQRAKEMIKNGEGGESFRQVISQSYYPRSDMSAGDVYIRTIVQQKNKKKHHNTQHLQPPTMMQPRMVVVAALITTYATTYACVILSALMLIELPVAVSLLFLSPFSLRHHHNVYSSSNTLLSATKTSSASIKRIMVPSSMDISILEPIGNGTFGGVYHARDEKSGERTKNIWEVQELLILIFFSHYTFLVATRTTIGSEMCQGHHHS